MRIGAQIALVTATAFFFTAVAPLEARADDGAAKREQARQFFEAGKRFYEMQNWRAAIDQFKQAAQLIPSPILDYNIALCYEKLGKPRTAIKFYKRYLQGMPKADNRSEVEAKIAALEKQVAQQEQATAAAQATQPPAGQPGPAGPSPTTGAPSQVPSGGTPGQAQGMAPPPPPPPGDDEFVPPPPEYPMEGLGDYSYMGKAKPVTAKPVTSKWWFWLLISLGITFTVLLAVALALADDPQYSNGYGMAASGLRLDLSKPGFRVQPGFGAQPFGHRPLLAPPPSPAGVLFRF